MVLNGGKICQTGPSGPNRDKHLPNRVKQGQTRLKWLKKGSKVVNRGLQDSIRLNGIRWSEILPIWTKQG